MFNAATILNDEHDRELVQLKAEFSYSKGEDKRGLKCQGGGGGKRRGENYNAISPPLIIHLPQFFVFNSSTIVAFHNHYCGLWLTLAYLRPLLWRKILLCQN